MYVVAPLAVKVAVPPTHIVAEFTVMVGVGLMVIVAIADDEHPPVLPVTV